MASFGHLTRRFFGSLRPGRPPASDQVWVQSQLTERELVLWRSMSRADQRHSVQVARSVERTLGHQATPAVLAAALLHDVGKTVSGLGTYGRVVATLSVKVVGPELVPLWTNSRGFIRRVGLYLQHDELGADLLGMAESDPLTIAWAREHHWPGSMWSLPKDIAQALHDADDD